MQNNMDNKTLSYNDLLNEISNDPNKYGFKQEITALCDYLQYYLPCDRSVNLPENINGSKSSFQIQQDLEDIVTLELNEIARLMKLLTFVCVEHCNNFVWKMVKVNPDREQETDF